MGISLLSFKDILLFAASTILILTLILLLKKINSKNYKIIGTLSVYYLMITLSLIIIISLRFNYLKLTTVWVCVFISTVYNLHNLFHYFSLQIIILKNTRFELKILTHFLPILLFEILIFIFFEPIYASKENRFLNLFETQNLIYSNTENLIMGLLRIAHPFVYIILGSVLVYSFYKSPSYQSFPKSIRSFIIFFLFQKIFLLAFFLVGFLHISTDFVILSEISITGFSITTLIISPLILLNPNLFIQFVKPYSDTKKTTTDTFNGSNLFFQMNYEIQSKQLFLDPTYNLTNLSSDSGISANSIREIITNHGFKNYSAYINSFRIDYAEQLILNGYLDMYSIDSLSKDSGFQSLVTFYRVFKSILKCTPKEYSFKVKK